MKNQLNEITPVEMHNEDSAEEGVGERRGVEEGDGDGGKVEEGHHALGRPHLHVVARGRARNNARSWEPIKKRLKIVLLSNDN